MTREEAIQQTEAFFRRLGEKASFFDGVNHVEARVGEAVIGFEYHDGQEILSAQALIYRFRREPKDSVLDAVFAEENESNSGGGRVVYNSENSTFYLQRDFQEKIGESVFFDAVNRLAQASLRWNGEILTHAAEKARL